MDFYTLSSKGVTDELTCALCNNLLSYFPVYNCGNRNICGRCTLPQKKKSFRNKPYEVIARWLRFPCRYKDNGCDEELFPEDVPQHEETCVHRIIQCALADPCRCDWTGGFRDLIPHCRDEHVDKILQNGEFEVDLQQNSERNNLLEYNNQLFHVESKFDMWSNFLEFAIYHIQAESDDKQYSFQLVLKNGTRTVSMEINTTKYNEKCFVDVSINLLRNRSETLPTHIQAKITTESDYEFNGKILKHLECMKCTQLVIPPVYHCVLEKAILCLECYEEHLSTCENCKLFNCNLENSRVKNFEQIMYLCDYTCKNRKHGCTVVAKPSEMIKHYKVCPFREVLCVFEECKWKDSIEKITLHIEANHQNAIVNSSEISLELTANFKNMIKIIKFREKMFMVQVLMHDWGYLCCVVQEIKRPGFLNFQMNIFNKNRTQKLVVTPQNHNFLPESGKTKFELFVSFCLLTLDQIKEFRQENRLTFGIDILKHNTI